MSRNTTIALLAVLSALLIYLVAVQLPRDRAAAQATPTAGAATEYVWTANNEQVNSVRIEDLVNDRSVALEKDGAGNWSLTAPEPSPADPIEAGSAVSRLTGLVVNSTVTTTTDLEPFGVLSPTHTLALGLVDGTRLEAVVGDKTPTGSGYYLLRSGESNVLVVSSFYVEEALRLLDEPPVLAPTTDPGTTPVPGTETPTAVSP